MSTAHVTKLLANLGQLGIRLWVEGEHLRFKAPKGALTPELKAALSAQKDELLEMLRNPRSSGAPALPPIQPRSGGSEFPLSFSQERLWLIEQFEPGNAAYNIFDAIEIAGRPNACALEQTINEIVRRHEILRTIFFSREGKPLQSVLPQAALPLCVLDLEGLPDAVRETEFQRLLKEEVNRPFDLSHWPLLKVFLFRFSDCRHVLLLNLHHIVSDGWSSGVLVAELKEIYQSFSSGSAVLLPPLPIQYADFACWQREWMKHDLLKNEISFWKRQLAGAPEVLQLSTDRPRPKNKSSRGAVHAFHISPEFTKSALELCRQQNITLFMLLLGAWDLLLSRYSGQPEVVVGTPVANRIRPELEPLIGFFVNTLALCCTVSDDSTFIQLLQHVREITLNAQDHQELPFEKLVEELQPKRDTSYTPIFQVMFVLQNAPVPEIQMPGMVLRRIPVHGDTSKFDLLLSLQQSGDALNAELEYDTELFNASTMERMVAHFCSLLASALAHPHARTSDLALLSDAESRQLLFEWNNTVRIYSPQQGFIHQEIERQAELRSDAVAVIFEDQKLTYGELNRRANQLAWKLRSLGAQPGVLVAICIERSLEMVVGLLGILKAGAAYVPLDPGYPKDRLDYMMRDAKAPVLLTQASLRGVLPVRQARVLCLDSDWLEEISSRPKHNPKVRLNETDLAYVIYTSGSTGQPKGAMNTHAGIRNRLLWMQETYQLTTHDAVLQKTPFSFDVSVWEFFWPLMAGARLVVAKPGGHQDSSYLVKLIRSCEITTIHFVPSMLQMFLEESGVEHCASLKRVICSGEALPWELKHRFFTRLGCELHNLYGPTEAAVDVTFWRCQKDDGLQTVPIGHPIANAQMHVLDRRMKPVPQGVAGELYIGGVGLARGYWNRPALTAEKFLPNPFGDAGSRLYRTGDLGRYREDGAIEYLGRADHQVKIRGFRIELGEIEAALLRCQGVKEAVVTVREERAGDKRLVAYVAAAAGTSTTQLIETLKEKLKQELPAYMAPSAFVSLERLPLSPNGKVDRKALPAPNFIPESASSVLPRTPTEESLAGIWSEVLGIPSVGIHNNFFDLGGHSLLALQVISRTNDAFKVDLSLRALFEAPTIAGLAEKIETALLAGGGESSERIELVSRQQPLPLSFSQENLWLFEQLSPGTSTYTTSRAGRIYGLLNPAALQDTVNEVLRRHEALRTSLENSGGLPLQIVHPPRRWPLPVVDLSGLASEDREREAVWIANSAARRHIDLGSAPVAEFSLLRLAAEDHVFILSIHHAAYDLWSGGILLSEIERAYLAFAAGWPFTEPEPAIQYADFAVWQRKWLHGEALENQLAYWKERLGGLSAIPMDIPTDRPRPAVETFPGASVYHYFSTELAEKLRGLARREGVTQFMLLLAAFKVLLHRYTRQPDVVVGSVIANRNRPEMERTMGFFDNIIVLRSDASHRPTFRDFLRRVRDVALGAYAHQHLPFEYLVKELQPDRIANRTPWIQAMFVFLLNYPAMEREIAGLKVVPYKVHTGRAMFDLLLAVWDSERGMRVEFAYNGELFDESSVVRMISHFGIILEAIAADPEIAISDLPLLSTQERRLLLEWNDTGCEFAPHRGFIHQAIAQQAQQAPVSVAVVFEGLSLTYSELNEQANRLARKLQSLGAGRGTLVGICMERSLEMVVGLLGILKSGAAYVPLDPDYPRERLAWMLQDADAPVLLIQEKFRERLPETCSRVLSLDAQWHSDIALYDAANLNVPLTGDDLAYVIYTSGSTGKPKAAMNTHEGIRNRLWWGQETFHLSPDDRVLQKTPFSFDVSVWEFFWPLIAGARLVVARPGGHQESSYLVKLIRDQGITIVHFVASMLQVFLEEPDLDGCSTLQRVMCSGEALPLEVKDKFFSRLGCELHDLYGPTEASVEVTWWECKKDDGLRTVPIGRPIANTRIYILDQEMQPVPIGVPGELYIGGTGVARGYWRRPDLTAEKFVPDPFSRAGGERLYRSGDVTRYHRDGWIEYLGRADYQVKIRGFRIELGEIEAALLRQKAVKEAVVIAYEQNPGDKRLVAYLVPAENAAEREEQTLVEELQAGIKEVLAPYMVPSAFVLLEKMPLLPNGKVNRKGLPTPEFSSLPHHSYVNPRDAVELQLAQIWEELLAIQPVGIRDNFFELGGHSLKVVQLAGRIRQQFGRTVPIAFFLQNPTIELLAAALREQRKDNEASRAPLVKIKAGQGNPPLFFVHPVGGNVLCYAGLARHLNIPQPFYGLQSSGDLHPATIEQMAAHYSRCVRAVQANGPYCIGGWSMGGVIAYEMARQLQSSGEQVEIFLIDAKAPNVHSPQEVPDNQALLLHFIHDLENLLGRKADISLEAIQGLEMEQALQTIVSHLRRQEIMPAEFSSVELLALFHLFSTNLRALFAYRPGKHDGPIALIKSSASAREDPDPAFGWRELLQGSFEIEEIEGDHYSIVTGAHVGQLAAVLEEKLSRPGRRAMDTTCLPSRTRAMRKTI